MILSRLGLPLPRQVGRLLDPRKSRISRNAKRFVSSEIQQKDKQAGDSMTATDTGVIHKTEEETLIYFDNVYPRSTSLWNPAQWYNLLLTNQSREAVREKIMSYASPASNPIKGLELRSSIPVKRDGGVFATFLVPPRYNKAEVNSMIQQNTTKESTIPFLSFFTRAAAFPVKGAPWIEDLRRLPTTTIVVNFQGPALTQEEMYSLFRRYGSIIDIFPSKGAGAPAMVKYRSFRGAICAKNCVSGIEIHNTVLHLEYERIVRGHMVQNFFMNHTRIALPVLIALLSIFAVLIFEPIREFFIEQKITHRYSISWENHWIKQLVNFTSSTMSHFRYYLGAQENATNDKHLWEERVEKVNDLKMWLEENNNTFVVIRGPRGSGKHELVMQHTLNERDNVLYLDCDKFIKSRTDAKFLRNVANQLGYFPIFPWLNSVTNVIDLMVQGLTGQKSGLSETKEAQFRNMLTTSMMSIRHIALRGYKQAAKQAGDLNLKEEDYLQEHPEEKPVIVLDRFTGRSEVNGFIYKELSDWAAMLVQMNIAHVIFLTETVSPNHILSESLPSQVFKTLILSDASKENSRNYVLSQLHDHLENPIKEAQIKGEQDVEKARMEELREVHEIDEVLEPLGGRMLDLQAFVRRVNSGEGPREALEKMVEQSSEQITQIFLSDKYDSVKSAQAWELIELLSKEPVVHFDNIVFRNLFKAAPESCITELENSGLITVSRNRGVPSEIQPAKPMFRAAFKFLVNDPELSPILRTRYLLKVVGFETNRIKKWEEELRPLGKSGETKLFKDRLNYLSKKIEISNAIINDCETEIKNVAQRKK